MRTHHLTASAALFFAMVSTMEVASAATSPTLSNRTFVDTRGQQDGIPKLVDTTPSPSDGRRFISYEMAKQALTRPVKDKVTVYLQLQMPEFSVKNGGWGFNQTGMGTFYGLEMKTFSRLTPFDTICYKVGGAVPTPDTPASDWKSMDFNSIIDIDLLRQKKTYYFKIVLAAEIYGIGGVAPGPLIVSARFQSARLCNEDGGPVTALDKSQPLWVVAHGRVDGEYSLRTMNNAIQKGAGTTQVVDLDWAKVAADEEGFLQGGRYVINLGKNLAGLLKEKKIVGNNVNWVGHSWGTYVGYETAKAMGKLNRFVALDPATASSGGYVHKLVDFGKVSAISTGVKGGNDLSGTFGSETKALTCDYSIRLFSETHAGDFKSPWFYHKLPRSWFINSMYFTRFPYWEFFHDTMLRGQVKPMMPEDWGSSFSYKIDHFNLECYGDTIYSDKSAEFVNHEFLRYNRKGVITEARATKKDGAFLWRYKAQ